MARLRSAEIWGNLWQTMNVCEKLLSDYEKVLLDEEIQEKLPYIENAYIDSIIVHIAKIFSNSKNESFRLEEFKKVCRPEISQKFQEIEENHRDIIGKIKTNRNQLVVHLDKKFYDLPFSEQQIERWIQEQVSIFNMEEHEARSIYSDMPRSSDKSKERYSIVDFRKDLPEINRMIENLHSVWSQSIPLLK